METLALKYRPRTIEDLVGQPHISLILRTMLERYARNEIQLPAGLILTGSRGIGKTSSARIIASCLNCESNPTGSRPCLRCAHCQAIQNFSSDAVIEVDGATSGLVDDIRELKQLARIAHSGKHRVILIDEAHAVSTAGFSSLLKQLEEPPPNLLYLLATTDFHRIPATIVSRCLTFTFTSIAEADIAARLRVVCEQEGFDYDPEALAFIAKRARGGLRDSLMMLDQLAVIQEITLDRCNLFWPGGLDVFAQEFLRLASRGEVEKGRELVDHTFVQHRNAYLLCDAIADCINEAIYSAVRDSRPAITPRKLADLSNIVWTMRYHLRNSDSTDATVIRSILTLFCREFDQFRASPGASSVVYEPIRTSSPTTDDPSEFLSEPSNTPNESDSEIGVPEPVPAGSADDLLKAFM